MNEQGHIQDKTFLRKKRASKFVFFKLNKKKSKPKASDNSSCDDTCAESHHDPKENISFVTSEKIDWNNTKLLIEKGDIPSFFNDNEILSTYQKKINQYNLYTSRIEDKEDIELYFVKKENLFNGYH